MSSQCCRPHIYSNIFSIWSLARIAEKALKQSTVQDSPLSLGESFKMYSKLYSNLGESFKTRP